MISGSVAYARRVTGDITKMLTAPENRPALFLIGTIFCTAVVWASLSVRVPDEGVYLGEIGDLLASGKAVARSTHPVGAFAFLGALFAKSLGIFGLSSMLSVRLLGAMCVALTALVAYETLRIVVPEYPQAAFAAAALVGLTPMFTFIGASGNSDTLLNLAAAVFFYALARYMREGLSKTVVIAAVFSFAAGISTKERMYVLLPLLVLAAALRHVPRLLEKRSATRESKGFWATSPGRTEMALMGGAAALVVFWRPITGLAQSVGSGVFPRFATFDAVMKWVDARGHSWLLPTYWADFGYLDVWAPRWMYSLVDALVIAAAAGAVIQLLRLRRLPGRRLVKILGDPKAGAYILSAVALLAAVYSVAQYEIVLQLSSQGRYLFIAMVPIAVLVICGIFGALPTRYHLAASSSVVTGMFLINWYSLLYVVLPASY